MNRLTKLAIAVSALTAAVCAYAGPYTIGQSVSVTETGVSPTRIVTIWSSTLGTQTVYAGVTHFSINGTAATGFCIDPYQWSSGSSQQYTVADLATAPIPAMGTTAAALVNSLWAGYYQQALTNADTAAGLQIAIWETVAGSNFSISGSDYGAAAMLAYASQHAADAGLVALTSRSYQDYVVQNVDDNALTLALLGVGLIALVVAAPKLHPALVRHD